MAVTVNRTTRFSTGVVEFAKVWGVLAAIVVVGFILTYRYVGEPPPKTVRIATGGENGAYYGFAQQYARLLAADGITLEVVQTAGSVENLERLRRGDVTLALVQGGSATPEDREELEALGSLFLEPVWVLTREPATFPRLSAMNGARIAIGRPGSGTFLLARQLLSASGVSEANATFLENQPSDTGRLLSSGGADAAFLVASAEAAFIQDLVRQPGIALFPFDRAAAYSRVFPFLAPVVISEGVLDLARNIPSRDTTALACATTLAARADLHEALLPAVLNAVTRVHRAGGILETRGRFPSTDLVDLPLNEVARHYIVEGPSFLYRWLPYGTAVMLDRLKLLILPLLALLIPLFRVAPPLYQWRIRSRIYRWYGTVRELDRQIQGQQTAPSGTATVATRLAELDREVASITVPLAYAGELYHLREHIRLLQEKLATAQPTS